MLRRTLTILLLLTGSALAAADGLAGRWQLNEALTRELQPPQKGPTSTSSGMGPPMIYVGGMPVPVPGTSGPQPGIGGAATSRA